MVARASLQALARVPIYSQPLGPKGGRVLFLINLENTGSGGGQNASFLKAPGGSRRVLKNSGNEGSMRALEGSWPNVIASGSVVFSKPQARRKYLRRRGDSSVWFKTLCPPPASLLHVCVTGSFL